MATRSSAIGWQEQQKRAVELKKVPPCGSRCLLLRLVNLNGDWEAVADANGQPFPFSLTLKVDGETVTGSSSSQLGDSMIKSGTWKDGKLAVSARRSERRRDAERYRR